MNDPVLILGATSAIARAVATRLATENRDLILAGRNRDELERCASDLRLRHDVAVRVQTFDATDLASHAAFVADCLDAAGGQLGGVVLCHGYMADQQEAQRDFDEVKRMIDTNFTSAASVLDRLAGHFEERKAGFVCAVSSVAGDRGRGSNYLYGSTKAALTAYLQGLRNRLAKAGVAVVTVKPGFVDTRMTWGLPKLSLVASPERVGRDICHAIHKKRNEIYTPWFWWGIMTIIRTIPEPIFKKLKL